MGLWHWLLKNAFSHKADILNPYKAYEVQPATAGGKLYLGNTLSGRLTISSKMTSGANYQDQGTGAEIAFRALRALPEDIQSYLINFVHDELLLEVPEARVAEVQALVEKTMITAADSLLLRYGIPTEVETSMGDCWVH
jgi:DNA polymerase I - 3''-5'' exonuclease and polymerase domains